MFNLRHTTDRAARTSRPGPRALALAAAACLASLSAGGCATGWTSRRGETPPAPMDAVVLRGGQMEADAIPDGGTAAAEFEGARRLYQDGQYAQAERIFRSLARDRQNSLILTEEALYYEADCARLQGCYPRAAELYNAHLKSYPSGRNTAKARERLFEIANYWLDPTREYMQAVKEKRAGERWFVMPVSFINFDKTKPVLDCKGHALRMLEQVYLTDPTGPLAEKALFYLGTVKFFEEDYRDADHFFSELIRHHPNGKYAPQAVELSIVCKQMATGGSEYDNRLTAEARELVDMAMRTYPELANNRREFLTDQLHSINQQQADKDWRIAEFYRRQGKPGSAYLMYEIVTRRYQGTEYARKAAERMREIDARRERSKETAPPAEVPESPGRSAPPAQLMPGAPLGEAPHRLPPLGNPGRI